LGNKKFVEAITSRDKDFAQWYTDVCVKAEMMDYSEAKGFIIYRPYGYALWENIQFYLDKEFKKTGHQNVYMPLVIPESLFLKEAEHVEGFAPETAIITIGGNEELQKHLVWIKSLDSLSEIENIDDYLKQSVGKIFEQVLEDCNVFKHGSKEDFINFVNKAIY
jgi:hypothetical protein